MTGSWIMLALFPAAALTPQMAGQIRDTLPPSSSAPRIEGLAESGELVVFCVVTKDRAQVEVARFAGGQLQGDPDQVGGPLRRESCGTASAGEPFEVKRGKKRTRAVVVSLAEAGLSAVVSLAGRTLAWTDLPAPDGGPAIFPEKRGKGETTFCAYADVPGKGKGWTRIGWVPDADGYAPIAGRCGR